MSLGKELEILERLKKEMGIKSLDGIPKRKNLGEYPLSFAQERMWFTSQLDPNSAAYNIPLAMRIEGYININQLEQSFNFVLQRHEVLRARFTNERGVPVQHISPFKKAAIQVVEVSGEDGIDQKKHVKKLVNERAASPIALDSDWLFNITLYKLSENEHILLLVLHHVIFDGWSTGVLMNEIIESYHSGEESSTDLTIQYADYAEWQRDKLSNGEYQNQVDYWKGKIGSNPPELQLPYDYPRQKGQSFDGDIKRFTLNRSLISSIIDASKEYRTSPFVILLSAYYLFLYKYTGQKEIILGVPISNRQQLDIEPLIGCIANTIPVKGNIQTHHPISNFIEQVSIATREAQDHQELPFDKLVDELDINRTLSYSPVFQSMFVFQHQHHSSLKLGSSLLTPYEVETKTSKFDLSLSIMETEDGIEGFIEYCDKLFKPETINRMVANYINILEEIVYEPNKLVSEISGMSQAEKQVVLGSLDMMTYEKSGSIHHRFEEQVQKFPSAVALASQGHQMTYTELDQQSNQLARYLQRKGVGSETKVAVNMDRSIDYIVSILAVLKAGGTYIPMDPDQPSSRLRYIIEDSKCEILLTKAMYKKLFDDHINCLVIQYEDREWMEESCLPLNIPVNSDQVAYIIYTSGSTGKPKGVLNTHHNVLRLFDSTRKLFQFTEKDSWTLFHSTAFDFTVWEIWGALFHGGRLHIISSEMRRTPEKFYRLLHEEGITVLNQTPSAFKELLNVMNQERHSHSLEHLRYIVFGGEALNFQDLAPWFEQYGNQTSLINMYGITETTVHVTWREVNQEDTKKAAGSLIGRPLEDLKVYVLNDELNPAPIGVPGEMYVSGEGLARGYSERFALTAERFIPNPLSLNGGRLYKTGDIGRYTPDGDIEYVGRMDDQVKIKGHRIELGEIKSFIADCRQVKDCSVLVRTNEKNEKELAAFVVFNKPDVTEDLLRDLRKTLIDGLPKYMFPSHLLMIESIPVTTNGKVDKDSLLKLCENTRQGVQRKPETKVEKDLIEIWKHVLNKEEVHLEDNFFSLGGDSIRSLKVISEAEEKGYLFTIEELFQNQTIEELVQLLSQKDFQENEEGTLSPFALISEAERSFIKEGIEDAYPLTRAQEGMFFHMEQYPDEPLYHNIDSVLLKGQFHYELFMKAVQEIVSENVMLRTSFDLKTFQIPMQLVHKTASLPVGYLDIRNFSHNEQEHMIDQYVEQEKKNTFDLTKPSLLRFFIHQRSDDTFQFSLTECHLIFDGWSLTSTLAEIFQLYFQLLEGETARKRLKLSIDFRDFVNLERQAIESNEHIEFWKDFLSDCQTLKLPIYESKKLSNQAFKVQRRILELSKETSHQLKKLSESCHVPVKSILLASHIKALQSMSGQSDIVTGMVSNGRMEKKDGEKVKGLFINTLPFRQKVEISDWVGLINRTFELEQTIMPYRRLPLPEIQRHVNQAPLFETAFNYVYFHSMEPLLTSDKMEFLGFNSNSANDTHFKLMVTFSNHPPDYEIRLTLAYDESTFTEEQMDTIVEIYHNILKSISSDPLSYHDQMSYLPENEYEKIVHLWNENKEEFPAESLLLHELIEEQAIKSPHSVALVYNDEEVTYETLNNEGDKIASFLKKKGLSENSFIGIYMDRSFEMMIGLVGILKAGCAYVPLDTSYPSERIQYMVKDSRVECILTSHERGRDLEGLAECYMVKDILRENHMKHKAPSAQKAEHQLAYMIYTSGSTGQPKGVKVPHKGVVNRILWMQKNYGEIKSERGLHKTPLSFDYSVFEIFSALCTGAALILAKPDGHKDSGYLAKLIKDHDITTLYFVPTMLQEFLNVPDVESCTSIKRVLCSGEPLTPQIKENFFNKLDGDLYNQYGPTEASVEVTSFKCDESVPAVRIGKPMANVQLYLLNDDLQPVGIGVIGELYIGGAGLATGYNQNPSLTAENFIPNPFSSKEGDRLYKTGDLAKYTPDGEIEYVGRKDSQIKLRGIRIELSEIESAIRGHHLLKDGIVLYKKDKESPQGLLIGYVIPESGVSLTEQEVKNLLKGSLPRFMIPERMVLLDAFPVNPNGKLDRKALPKPSMVREGADSEYSPPVTPIEKQLAVLYEKVLNVDRVGLNDDFFELGGNSLTVVHLMNHIEKILGQKVPLDIIFDNPTISQLLEKVNEKPSS
ncbi:non-ribosomal peptide synthetase [Metabacillus arenae]|uniref:Amino acid adenylation domain-containing protein n=1 Tax=Metabacillus arenae TaxID=2771434 RepID=A0A926RZX9_9BACI|nr:non-ribosomal peptide synthetase [Metabacillus arenae]MBD1379489.1 amino acid adenylation domain-containing protein [Metabacillus arenae]